MWNLFGYLNHQKENFFFYVFCLVLYFVFFCFVLFLLIKTTLTILTSMLNWVMYLKCEICFSLFDHHKSKLFVSFIDIHRRSRTSYIAPFNGVVSHGAQIGGLRVFADHTHKINAPTIFARRAMFYAFLSSCSDRGRCRWHTHLMNHGYFDYGKNPKTPIWAPYRNKDGAGSGISGVYLLYHYKFSFDRVTNYQHCFEK